MNLRKDHCRNLQSRPANMFLLFGRTTWAQLTMLSHVEAPFRRCAQLCPSFGLTNPGAESAKENTKHCLPLVAPVHGVHLRIGRVSNLKRLSATDISALASMKNAAKCDTWCELQNPVNHRVFERKLRPKPLCRGHVCLGVTHSVTLHLRP